MANFDEREYSDFSAEVLGLPESVRVFLRMGEAIVAAAATDVSKVVADRIAAELSALGVSVEDGTTAAALAALSHDLPDVWDGIALMYLGVENRWLTFERLLGGAVHRRIDAIYDMADTDYCAHEVQSTYLDAVEELRVAAKTSATHAGEWATSLAGGFAGGFIGLGGGPARRATEWLDGAVSKPRSLTFELGEIAVAWMLLSQDERTNPLDLARARARCREYAARASETLGKAKASGVGVGEATAAWNMWKAVCEFIVDDANIPSPDEVLLPSLREHTMSAARHQVEGLGLTFGWCDAMKSGGTERTPWIESNWKALGQYPPAETLAEPGARVVVAVAKFGDAGSRAPHFADELAAEAARQAAREAARSASS